ALVHAGATAALALGVARAARPAGVALHLGAVAVLAVGLCWGANTFSHIHLHTPLFRRAAANRAFTLLLTVTLGIPQSIWRQRHLRHHGLPPAAPGRARRDGAIDLACLAAAWLAALLIAPWAFVTVYLPAWLLGLALCAAQGRYEHAAAGSAAVDCRHRLYNRLWFNDGYHEEHHRAPSARWSTLPAAAAPGTPVSRWPPLVRWMDR